MGSWNRDFRQLRRRPARPRFITDTDAMDRIVRAFDDATQTVGDLAEEVARLVRLTGRTLKHDDESEEP
jgi:hypothetical protein